RSLARPHWARHLHADLALARDDTVRRGILGYYLAEVLDVGDAPAHCLHRPSPSLEVRARLRTLPPAHVGHMHARADHDMDRRAARRSPAGAWCLSNHDARGCLLCGLLIRLHGEASVL